MNRHNDKQRDRMALHGWEYVGTFPSDYDKAKQSQDYSWVDVPCIGVDGFGLLDVVNVYRMPIALESKEAAYHQSMIADD